MVSSRKKSGATQSKAKRCKKVSVKSCFLKLILKLFITHADLSVGEGVISGRTGVRESGWDAEHV